MRFQYCLNAYASPIRSSARDGRTYLFFPSILPIFRNLFILGDCNYHHSLRDSKSTSDPSRKEVFYWVISSDLLNDSDIPTILNRSSPDIFFASSSLASGKCFRTWALITYQFYKPSFFLRSFASTNVPVSSIFRKLIGKTLLFTLTLTVLLQRHTRLFLFPLLLLSLLLCH